jgi:pseudouridine-5'-phosphate glycosidase
MSGVVVGEAVREALAAGRAVVALESTIFSSLGLPAPKNMEALDLCVGAIEAEGAVAAVCAVLGGRAVVGLDGDDVDAVLSSTRKVAERDLAVAVASRVDAGVTTVSATLALAASAGIGVFATGGMGGVHRGAVETGDVSADIGALARHGVALVSAGAKAILDLPRTLEALETAGVPVVGLATDDFPAFYSRSSGLAVPHRVDDEVAAAAVIMAHRRLGLSAGVLIANPIPATDEISLDEMEPVVAAAVESAEASGVRGAALTPFLLGQIAMATGGRGVDANLALARHNAAVGARIAVELATLGGRPSR